ncbi:type 1 glutamine amidotransferase [Thiolapillus sp.]
MADWFADRGGTISCTRLYQDKIDSHHLDFDLLVVMGGPMGVYDDDQYPWLADEKQLIAAAIERGRKVLGICLGAQLIATVLGAPVTRNREVEIGWFPVRKRQEAGGSAIGRVLPEQLTAFHWHGDTFAIPNAAVPLYRSEACDNQAFVFEDRVVGLQFHLETTPTSAAALVQNCADELVDAPYVQSATEILGGQSHYPCINETMCRLLAALST